MDHLSLVDRGRLAIRFNVSSLLIAVLSWLLRYLFAIRCLLCLILRFLSWFCLLLRLMLLEGRVLSILAEKTVTGLVWLNKKFRRLGNEKYTWGFMYLYFVDVPYSKNYYNNTLRDFLAVKNRKTCHFYHLWMEILRMDGWHSHWLLLNYPSGTDKNFAITWFFSCYVTSVTSHRIV